MTRGRQLDRDRHAYSARVAARRPANHYTPRVIPYHAAASVPLEASAIRWLR